MKMVLGHNSPTPSLFISELCVFNTGFICYMAAVLAVLFIDFCFSLQKVPYSLKSFLGKFACYTFAFSFRLLLLASYKRLDR